MKKNLNLQEEFIECIQKKNNGLKKQFEILNKFLINNNKSTNKINKKIFGQFSHRIIFPSKTNLENSSGQNFDKGIKKNEFLCNFSSPKLASKTRGKKNLSN